MKILIVGGGGREHALAWRLAQSPSVTGIVRFARQSRHRTNRHCVAAPARVEDYAALAEAHGIDLTVVGPEAPLVAGIVDRLSSGGAQDHRPDAGRGSIEGSKIFAKQLFERAGIPTARILSRYRRSARTRRSAIVIKADGLAAGKGVVIAHDRARSRRRSRRSSGQTLSSKNFSKAKKSVSSASATDVNCGRSRRRRITKRVFDGDQGPIPAAWAHTPIRGS